MFYQNTNRSCLFILILNCVFKTNNYSSSIPILNCVFKLISFIRSRNSTLFYVTNRWRLNPKFNKIYHWFSLSPFFYFSYFAWKEHFNKYYFVGDPGQWKEHVHYFIVVVSIYMLDRKLIILNIVAKWKMFSTKKTLSQRWRCETPYKRDR